MELSFLSVMEPPILFSLLVGWVGVTKIISLENSWIILPGSH